MTDSMNYLIPEWIGSPASWWSGYFFFAPTSLTCRELLALLTYRVNPKAISELLYNKITRDGSRKGLGILMLQSCFERSSLIQVTLSNFGEEKLHERNCSTSKCIFSRLDGFNIRDARNVTYRGEALARAEMVLKLLKYLFASLTQGMLSFTLTSNTVNAWSKRSWLQREYVAWAKGFRFYDLKRLNLSLR